MFDLRLDFKGPYRFVAGDDCLFNSSHASCAGVYLWTFVQETDGTHLVCYVGETVNFARRHREHLIHILGMNYGFIKASAAKRGECVWLWRGLWRDKSPDGPGKLIANHATLAPALLEYLDNLMVFFAPCDGDETTRKRLETAISHNLRTRHPEDRVLYPDDNYAGVATQRVGYRLRISAPQIIRGLDPEIEI